MRVEVGVRLTVLCFFSGNIDKRVYLGNLQVQLMTSQTNTRTKL